MTGAYACRMNSIAWLEAVAHDDSGNAVAQRAKIHQPTLSRQRRAGKLGPETVVAIARAYNVPVLPGLVACGLITEAEAALKERVGDVEQILATASDADLLRAVLARVEGGANLHTMLRQPLDSETVAVVTADRTSEMPEVQPPKEPTN